MGQPDRYSQIVENSKDGMALLDRDYVYLEVNPSYARLLGREVCAVRGHRVPEFLREAHFLEQVKPRLDRCFEGETVFFETAREIPGVGIRFLEVQYSPCRGADGAVVAVSVSLRDFTERKRAVDSLRESEGRARAKLSTILSPEGEIHGLELAELIDTRATQSLMDDFFALTGTGVGIIDLRGQVLVATGWQEICTRFHRVHPETCRACIESDTLLSSGVAPGTFKLYRCKNNLWDMATPITLDGRQLGNVFLGQFFFEDEEPDRELFRAQARRHGFDEEEYLAALDQVPRWSREKVERTMAFYARFAQLISELSYSNVKLARTLAERQQAEAERERLQAQLLQAQKMEAVGRLAGGVAHDFNNMLGTILGNADLALEQLTPEHPIRVELQEIREAADRSADLTRQLLAFARRQTVAPRILDLNQTVDGMLKMLRRLIGEDIDLAWMPAAALWPVKIDPSQLDQVLANLCVNARDAIEGVGKVTIETANARLDESYCEQHAGCVPGEYVMLAVSDDGRGMHAEVVGQLFEPFFTTKELGKGTGLGLATVHGIVKQNGGVINVYSEPGRGTTFKIYLPRVAGRPTAAKGAEPLLRRGQETILLVEDEPAVLRVGKRLLEKLGYSVLAAATPVDAIRLATEHAGAIDLLMTDVVMPEMNGRVLARKLISLYPEIRCLFTSGYTANVIAHHGVLDEGVNFLQKPYSRQDLAAKVREVLDGE